LQKSLNVVLVSKNVTFLNAPIANMIIFAACELNFSHLPTITLSGLAAKWMRFNAK